MDALVEKLRTDRPAPLTAPKTAAAANALGKHAYDFYQCLRCQRLLTLPEMIAAVGPSNSGRACPCGGLKYSPVNLPRSGWLLPRVWWFALLRICGRV